MSVRLEDFPADVRDAVRDFSEIFVRVIDGPGEITAERVAEALRSGECERGAVGYYATHRQHAVHEAMVEHLRGTYDEFRSEVQR